MLWFAIKQGVIIELNAIHCTVFITCVRAIIYHQYIPVFTDTTMFVLPALLVPLLFVTVPSEALDFKLLKLDVLPTITTSTPKSSLTTNQNQKIQKLNTTLVSVSGKHNQTMAQGHLVPMPTNESLTLLFWRTVKLYSPVVPLQHAKLTNSTSISI